MSILDRASLEESPLADLHTIASELSLDGYRRLRKAALIDRILERQGDGDGAESAGAEADEAGVIEDEPHLSEGASDVDRDEPTVEIGDEPQAHDDGEPAPRRRRGRRGGRGRAAARDDGGSGEEERSEAEPEPEQRATRRGSREETEEEPRESEDELVEGVVELLPNGSGFVRVEPPEPSDGDVYVSAAQVKRCELVSGDRVGGPRRPPRRSERFASLLRVDTINGRPASELADGAHFDDLPAAFPSERFSLDSDDPTLKAIAELAPIGRGSRVTIVGGPQAGKTEALRRLAAQLSKDEQLQVWVALAGIRPEEISEWRDGPVAPSAAASLAASSDAQGQAVEGVIEQARRMAARGSHIVVLIDTLVGLAPNTAQRALAAARKIVDGGSLTVIATGAAPLGGETTVIALDAQGVAAGKFPAVDRAGSWTMRAELLLAG
jgi:transcription termination factor Rho